jgi:hypothetical protein
MMCLWACSSRLPVDRGVCVSRFTLNLMPRGCHQHSILFGAFPRDLVLQLATETWLPPCRELRARLGASDYSLLPKNRRGRITQRTPCELALGRTERTPQEKLINQVNRLTMRPSIDVSGLRIDRRGNRPSPRLSVSEPSLMDYWGRPSFVRASLRTTAISG